MKLYHTIAIRHTGIVIMIVIIESVNSISRKAQNTKNLE